MRLLLGSASPRRRELLAGLDIPFEIVRIDCEESFPQSLTRGDIPLFLAKKKAAAYADHLHADDLLLTADTIVWLDDMMLGKPHDEDDARPMLRLLSGKTHQVYTAVCLTSKKFLRSASLCSPSAEPCNVKSKEHEVPNTQLTTRSHQHEVNSDSFVVKTDVTFRELEDREIDYYVTKYRPLDKAGAYGIQEWIGYVGITNLNGSYYNVMGLPVQRVAEKLRNYGLL